MENPMPLVFRRRETDLRLHHRPLIMLRQCRPLKRPQRATENHRSSNQNICASQAALADQPTSPSGFPYPQLAIKSISLHRDQCLL